MTDGDANFVILHEYDVDPAGDSRRELWPQFVPRLKEIDGFVAVYTFDEPAAQKGVSLTFWATEEAANTYLNSSARKELDTRAEQFRPETNRRLMAILQADDTRY